MGCALGSFVMNRALRIKSLCHVIGLDEVWSVAGLVSKTPHYHGRMIIVTLDHSLNPFDMSCLIGRIIGKRLLAIAHSVRLDVRLIQDIKSIAVAERVPERVIRIVTGTYSIDIQLFHYLNITNHIRLGNHISLIRIHFMPVDTLDEHRLAIHLELTTLDADISEADGNACPLCPALPVEGCEPEVIEPWCLGRPLKHLRNLECIGKQSVSPLRTFLQWRSRLIFHDHLASLRIEYLEKY